MWHDFDVFKLLMNLPDHKDGLIDIYSMIVIGLLWCDGDPYQKIIGLYQILRDPCKLDKVCKDSDSWNIVFPKLIKIATIFTYSQI